MKHVVLLCDARGGDIAQLLPTFGAEPNVENMARPSIYLTCFSTIDLYLWT